MTETPTTDPTIPEDYSLDDWIESGTVARRTVTIYNDHAAAIRLGEVEAELAEAGWTETPTTGDGPLAGQTDPRVAELLEERERLTEQVVASGAVWTVRALGEEDVEATFDTDRGGVPEPKRPVPPLEKAGQKAQDRFAEQVATYQRRVHEAKLERELLMVAAAVVTVETPRGTITKVTADQLRRMRAKEHGAKDFRKLYAAMEAATDHDVDLPRPSSREDSTTTRA